MPLRKPHYLQKLTSTNRPTRMIFQSTRKDQILYPDGLARYSFRIGYARYCRTRRAETLRQQSTFVIADVLDYWLWVTGCITTKSNVYLVSPHLAEDLVLLKAFEYLPDLGYEVDMAYISDSVAIVIWHNHKGKLYCLDNNNLFRGNLARWQALAQVPDPSFSDDMTLTDQYASECQHETAVLHSLYRQWFSVLDDHDLGAFKLTVAGQALSTYRYRFMKYPVYVHSDEEALFIERKAYRGGRVECFRVGHYTKGPYYYLDVNSMYGSVMRDEQYPTVLWGVEYEPSLKQLEYRLNTGCVIAECTIKTDKPHFPYKIDTRYVYPIGTFRTFLTTMELEYALAHQAIIAVHRLARYAPAPLFRDFANFFFEIRRQYRDMEMEGLEEICKLLVNSLYGKTGQTGYEQKYAGEDGTREVYLEPSYYVERDQRLSYLHLAGKVFEIQQTSEAYNSTPAIAAHITAYARMRIAKLIDLIGRENLYYVDTDGVIVDQRGYNRAKHLINPTIPGMLKVETESPYVIVYSPKDYDMEGRIRLKGITPNAIQIAEGEYSQTIWHRIRGMLEDGQVDTLTSQKIIKRLNRKVVSGIVQADGRVTPFEIGALVPQASP